MFLAVQDLFDNPLFTRLGAIANPSIMWTSMAGKRSRFGMLEARGSNRPLNVFSTDSLRRAWTARIELRRYVSVRLAITSSSQAW